MGDPEYQKKFGMVSIPSKIINMHGSIDELEDESIQEMQQMVISTTAMPKEDWIRVRASCWVAAFLHFDKLLQIPLVIFNKQTGINYRQIFEAFMDFNMTMDLPVVDEARRFFISEAYNVQIGGSEFVQSKKWLNLFWPADEYFFIKMVDEKKLSQFYKDCDKILFRLLKKYNKTLPPYLRRDTLLLNHALIKNPYETKNEVISVHYNIMEYYKSILENAPIELQPCTSSIIIDKSQSITDWDEWLQKVVWYGNKKGGYLHGNYKIEPQLAGHY